MSVYHRPLCPLIFQHRSDVEWPGSASTVTVIGPDGASRSRTAVLGWASG